MTLPSITELLHSLPPRTRLAVEELAKTNPELFVAWHNIYLRKQAAAASNDIKTLNALFEEEKKLLEPKDE